MSSNTITVRLSKKLESGYKKNKKRGPALVDRFSQTTIFPANYNKPGVLSSGQTVKMTPFIKERLKSGELVEVRGKGENTEEPPIE